jgi:hypothetical protein
LNWLRKFAQRDSWIFQKFLEVAGAGASELPVMARTDRSIALINVGCPGQS